MLHDDRRRASSFGADADRYDRARPSYPEALIDELMLGRPRCVVDVGCGTGIASRLFASRGCDVLGIEADGRMAEVARRAGITVELTKFENWEPNNRTVDLLIAAQAWHWIDPALGAAKAASVLRPRGRLGLFWNCGRQVAGIKATFDDIYKELAPGIDEHSLALGHLNEERFESATRGLEAAGSFEPLRRCSYHWKQRYSRAQWLDHLPTHSDHQALPAKQLAKLLEGIGNAIDALGGSVTVDYETILLTTARI